MSNEFYYEMLNQSLKGIISGLGSGSGPTKNAIVVKLSKEIEPGEQVISENLIDACRQCQDGAYLIIASKVISISQRRIIEVPKYPLPDRHAPNEMFNLLKRYNKNNMERTRYKKYHHVELVNVNGIGTGQIHFITDNGSYLMLPWCYIISMVPCEE